MAAPIDADWSSTVITDNSLNKTTYGQGTSNPSTWPVDRLFWRSDEKILYQNTGTVGTPVWSEIGTVTPSGTITMYAGATTDIPSGWLLCNGLAVSRTTYSDLFDVLDTKYGIGDGSTTFNLPDFVTNNSFPRAATNDAGRGTTGGSSAVTLTAAQSGLPAHTHNVPGGNSASLPAGAFQRGTENTTLSTHSNTAAPASSSHENQPPFLDVHFIISV
jgi:microcystin-dependent protein